jgi:hypothetical protein
MTDRPTLDRIDEFIRRGESEHLEFKRRFTSDTAIARSLVAFANADGGILVIGVSETPSGPEVTGLTDAEARQSLERLRHLTRSLLPTPIPVGTIEIDGKPVVYASVNPLPPHLQPVTTAEGKTYRRQATRDVRLKRAPEPNPPPSAAAPCRIFVAMSFREEEEPALADYFRAMQRAAERVGPGRIELVRVDRVEGDYEISAQIMAEIDKCDVLLADFTLSPHNVYFEAGYARGRGKRVLQTARRGTVLEFDVRNWRTVFFRNATELEEHLVGGFADVCSRASS